VGNINFDGTGFEKGLWKNLWKICPEFVENFTRSLKIVFAPKPTGDRPHQLFHKFSTGNS